MVKSVGKIFKIAIFISGAGSNLKNLIKISKKKKSKFQISIVVSSTRKAAGLLFAKKNKIKTKIFDYKKVKMNEKLILSILKKNKIKLICLAGFMKILTPNFIKNFRGKIINIHPSLLPKYKGLNTHARALKNNDKYSGCTVHYVNSKLDSGKIIIQKKVKILKNDTPKRLQKRILKEEHKTYPKALFKIIH